MHVVPADWFVSESAAPALHRRISAPTRNYHWGPCVSQISAAPRLSSGSGWVRSGRGTEHPLLRHVFHFDSSELVSLLVNRISSQNPILWVDVSIAACWGRTWPFNKSLFSACLAEGFFVLLICWCPPSLCWRGTFLPPRKRHFVNQSMELESPGKCCEKLLISEGSAEAEASWYKCLSQTLIRDSVFIWDY